MCVLASLKAKPRGSSHVAQHGIQRGLVERAVVLHPTAHDRVDLPGEFGEGMAGGREEPPGPHPRTYPLEGFLADRGQERGKDLAEDPRATLLGYLDRADRTSEVTARGHTIPQL